MSEEDKKAGAPPRKPLEREKAVIDADEHDPTYRRRIEGGKR